MKRILSRFSLLLIVLLLGAVSVLAQEMKVKSFELLPGDITARAQPKQDVNGKNCAVVKVSLPLQGVKFDDGVIDVVYKTGEYWVYMGERSPRLQIKHDNFHPLYISFADFGIQRVESNGTYRLVVELPQTNNYVSQSNVTTQYVLFHLKPEDAVVELDGSLLDVNGGTATKRMSFGTYNYNVQAPLYHNQSGTVTVNDPKNKHVVDVELKPAYGFLSIPGTGELKGAKIFVNNELKGTAPWQSDRMASGDYNIRIAQTMYSPVQQKVTITDNNTTTFAPTLSADFANVTFKVANDAEIWVNDERKAIGQWSGKLSSGAYRVECKKASHRSTSREVNISPSMAGNTITLNAPTPIYGSIDVNSSPADADIYIDGTKVGTTPMQITELLIGTHSLRVSKSGYTEYNKDFTLKEGANEEFVAILHNGKRVELTSTAGASIYVDGQLVGTGSYSGTLSIGEHKAYAEKGGKKSNEKTITLTKDNLGDPSAPLRYELAIIFTSCTHRNHEWVDLGLPSRTKWATMNVGASSPSDYGDYFAWGESKPKRSYDWENLKYRTSGDSYSNVKFSKYVTESKYGKVDGKNELDKSDDAAHVNWGKGWRMPSLEQIKELKEKCTWTWTSMGGHNGYKVVGPNGKSLFLPAAGYRSGSSSYVVGSGGNYWSRSLYLGGQWGAYYLNFGSDHCDWDGRYYRRNGLSVRPVLSF